MFWINAVLILLLYPVSFQSLELNRVILSTDENPLYIEFWPVVAKAWNAMGIRPTLALISEHDCVDPTIGDVIRFDPIPGFSTAMQAQVYRLFLPALFPEEGCIISDIDMIPISKEYFVNNARLCPNNTFLIYRDEAIPKEYKEYPMCYLAAKGKIFGSIFRVTNPVDFVDRLRECRAIHDAFNTDQVVLYRWINQWELEGGEVMKLGHTVTHRLDRSDWRNWQPGEIECAIDAHCPRPYLQYKDSIDYIVQQTLEKLISADK
jgi:hypothetical protein